MDCIFDALVSGCLWLLYVLWHWGDVPDLLLLSPNTFLKAIESIFCLFTHPSPFIPKCSKCVRVFCCFLIFISWFWVFIIKYVLHLISTLSFCTSEIEPNREASRVHLNDFAELRSVCVAGLFGVYGGIKGLQVSQVSTRDNLLFQLFYLFHCSDVFFVESGYRLWHTGRG